jgi:CRP/FNR family transcriptional regulator
MPDDETLTPCPASDERPSDCILCAVRQSALFADLDDRELGKRLQGIRNAFWPANAGIYSQGQVQHAVFSIRSGLVKLVRADPGKPGRIVRLLGRGAAIGLEALDGDPYAHEAVAVRESNLCRIPGSVMTMLGERNPRLCKGLICKWREHAQSAEAWIVSLQHGSLEERAKALVKLLASVSGDPYDAVRVLCNDDMASLLGVSAESLSRRVAKLKRDGIIRRVGPWTYDCVKLLSGDAESRG